MAPATSIEHAVIAAWGTTLGLADVDMDENFFDLGGDSLLAAALAVELEDRTGQPVDPSIAYTARTPAAMAAALTGGSLTPGGPTWFNRSGGQPPLVMLAGAGASSVSLLRLAEELGEDQPVCVLPYSGLVPRTRLDGSVARIATRARGQLRAAGIAPPYRLAGYSAGGIAAFALATRLRDRGHAVAFLGLLDTPSPTVLRRAYTRRRGAWRETARVMGSAKLRARGAAYALRRRARQPVSPRDWARYAYDVHAHAAQRYAANPLDVPIVLFVATEGVRHATPTPPDLGWGRYVPDVEVVEVPGSHDLIREPFVGALGRALRQRLDGLP